MKGVSGGGMSPLRRAGVGWMAGNKEGEDGGGNQDYERSRTNRRVKTEPLGRGGVSRVLEVSLARWDAVVDEEEG